MTTRRPRPSVRFIEQPASAGRLGEMRLRMVSPAPWRPPTEVRATPDQLIVTVELAALDEAHTDVGLYDDVLVVEGSRRVDVGPPWPGRAAGPPSTEAGIPLPAQPPRTHDGLPLPSFAAPWGGIQQGPFRLEVPLLFEIDATSIASRPSTRTAC